MHPPFAKMLNGLAGWLVGFEGDFGFEQIGDNYTAHGVSPGLPSDPMEADSSSFLQVPYVGMRAFSAILGGITVPVVYATMRESGYPIGIAVFSALLILFGESFLPVCE